MSFLASAAAKFKRTHYLLPRASRISRRAGLASPELLVVAPDEFGIPGGNRIAIDGHNRFIRLAASEFFGDS